MALRKYNMHMTRQIFEELGEGRVRVTNRDGKWGVFRWSGEWLEGDVRDANPNMLVYTGGPNVHPLFNYRWTKLPVDLGRPSGWPEPLEQHLLNTGAL